jgi:micrococcal nuclease
MRSARVWYGLIAVACLTARPALGMSLAPCAGPVEASGVEVSRVEKDGVLVLADGRAVRAEGLLLPAGARDHAPSFFADQAVSLLSDLSAGRRVTLAMQVPKEDRYGRLRAQVFFTERSDEPWLQIAMLKRGLARVLIAPDRRECASELYAAEAEARRKGYGIWMSQAYAVRMPDDLGGTLGTFQIVEGKVLSAAVKDGRGYIDFGTDWRKDFKVTISPDDLKRFRDIGVDPRTYAGLTLRVRGFVDQLSGFEIEAASPQAIEVIQDP